MPTPPSAGACQLCRRTFRKSGMTSHLRRCRPGHAAATAATPAVPGIHLVVEDVVRPEYWLHLAVAATATLQDLDTALRRIWLECCYHLSGFRFGSACYDYDPFGAYFAPADALGDADLPNRIAAILDVMGRVEPDEMNVAVGEVAPPGARFRHDYDFSTPTELSLRSAAEIEVAILDGSGGVMLLARNDAPSFKCVFCDQPAAYVTPGPEDGIAMTAGICDRCYPNVDPDWLLPIINSPRSGVCGYDGEPLIIAQSIADHDDNDDE